jgi:hypothetical protein
VRSPKEAATSPRRGVYRFWRDLGYAIGTLLAGVIADLIGVGWAIGVVGGLTLRSGIITAVVMVETRARAPLAALPLAQSD